MQMEISWLLLALISALSAIFIPNIIKTRRGPERNLPPGPKPWPIIGNLNLVGSIPHQSFHQLSQQYGDIMLLKFGKFPVVVASSPKMAEQFLKVHDAVFASRPALSSGKHISFDYSDVSFSPYGPYWRATRKIFMLELLSTKKLESFEHIRVEERRCFLSRLQSLSGKPVVLRDHLSLYNLSMICRMVITDKYFDESEEKRSILDMNELLEMMNDWFFLSGTFNIGNWIPWLDFLDMQGYVKKMKALRKKIDRFCSYVIDDHIARRAVGESYTDTNTNTNTKKDFVDVLLQIAEDPNAEVELTRDCVKSLIMNVLLGGVDTITTALEWAIHEILKQPLIIERAKEELDMV